MIPPHHRHLLSSLMPLDLNQADQNHDQFLSTNHHDAASSSFSSISYPILFNPPQDQDQEGSYCWEPKHSPNEEEDEKIMIPSSGSWEDNSATDQKHDSSSTHELRVWKKEERDDENPEAAHEVKWLSSKMRIVRKMMVPDQRVSSSAAGNSMQRFEDKKQPLSPVGTDNSCSNNYSNQSMNNTVRVCADCNTTKTPLWRSGPRGPKTLCNACGIRQRKARRAMAAAAAAAAASGNGTILVTAAESSVKNKNKLQKKEKKKMKKEKSKVECAPPSQIKKKRRAKPCQSTKQLDFEDLTLSLSKNLASLQQVFPQDEKEAAILLMALSYGLVHG